MPPPTYTEPPEAPSRSNAPATFITRANAFIAWFATFYAELVTGTDWMDDTAAAVSDDADGVAVDRLATTAAQLATAAYKEIAETGAASAELATAAYQSFVRRYLGDSAADPLTDNDGGVLLVGALYWNTVANELRVFGGGGWLTPAAGAGYASLAGADFTGIVKFGSAVQLTGDISPTQITSNQNDYNPTGLSGASVLRLSTDASRNITGLQGGADGRLISIVNVGSFPLTLVDASASSTAAYRFDLGGDLTLASKHGCLLKYDATTSRWSLIGAPRASNSPDVIVQDQKSNGTAGQSLTHNVSTTRELNTVVRNVGSVGSLASNALTLPAGTWLLRARSAWRAGASAAAARGLTILYNSTDSTEIGRGEVINTAAAGEGGISEAVAVVTITASKAIQVRTAYASSNVGDGGLGIGNSLGVEVYTTLEATRQFA